MKLFLLIVLSPLWPMQATSSDDKGIDLELDNIALIEFFDLIETRTDFNFVYKLSDVDVQRIVSVKADHATIESVLDNLFVDTAVTYAIRGNQIFLLANKAVAGLGNDIEQSQRLISGTVSDDQGNPLPGANVLQKGTNNGTIADLDGTFSLVVSEENAILEVSFMGYETKEIPVAGQEVFSITLDLLASELEELVIVGYGVQRRALVTNAISKVEIEEDNVKTALSPTQLLEGRAAGVQVSSGSGIPGSAGRVSIRGAASISASNEPLYVVDGIPLNNTNTQIFNMGETMSPLASLNLNDIKSIEILKDAASAAIYGSRANNGVVLITTQSGEKGVSNMNVNFNYGFSEFPNMNKRGLVDSELYLTQFNEGAFNYNNQYGLSPGDANYKVPLTNPFKGMPDTDWLDLVTQYGQMYNANVSFSGGSDKTTFYLGGGYISQEGVIKTNSIEKVNLNAKLSHEFRPWLEVGTNNNVTYLRNNQVPGTNIGSTIIGRSTEQRPFDRPYKPNGEYYVGGTNDLLRHNPVQILNEQVSYLDEYRYLGNFYSLFKMLDNKLTFRSTLSTDMHYVYDYNFYNENHPYGAGGGRVIDGKRFVSNLLVENVLNYHETFNDWNFGAMLGQSYQKVMANTSNIDGRGFPSPAYDVISVASEIAGASGNVNEYSIASYFSRLTASYDDKYVLNATLRADGSSKFAPDTRWGYFPSVSLGWNLSEEDFMANSATDLKLRMSYGRTGNQDGISSYAYQALMAGGRNYRNESGIAVTSFGNPDLTWEIADQYDLGFDLSLLRGRINMMADVYLKNTNNLLYSRPFHATSGTTNIISNIGSMRNKGVEFTLNTDFNLGQVRWESDFNIATNKNEITSLLDDDAPISIGGNRALQVGEELGSFYLFIQEGIYQYDGEVPQRQYDMGVRAGDVKWLDVDDNDIINDSDRQVVGSSNPDFFGGWNNSFTYKNFRLDINTSFMYGNDVYAEWYPLWHGRIGDRYNPTKELVENRWTGPGSTNKYPRAISGDNNNHRNSDRWLEDGSFFRIRTIRLAYNFTPEQLEPLGFKNITLYVQGDNLFLFTNYSGWDPEVSKNMDPRFFGMDSQIVPRPRTISMGVNINI